MERIGETDLAKRQRNRVKRNDRRTNWSNDFDSDPVAHNQNHGQGVLRIMDRLKKRKTRKCLSVAEAEAYCSELIRAGYDFWTMYIPSEMSWVILTTNEREAADENQDQETN